MQSAPERESFGAVFLVVLPQSFLVESEKCITEAFGRLETFSPDGSEEYWALMCHLAQISQIKVQSERVSALHIKWKATTTEVSSFSALSGRLGLSN